MEYNKSVRPGTSRKGRPGKRPSKSVSANSTSNAFSVRLCKQCQTANARLMHPDSGTERPLFSGIFLVLFCDVYLAVNQRCWVIPQQGVRPSDLLYSIRRRDVFNLSNNNNHHHHQTKDLHLRSGYVRTEETKRSFFFLLGNYL